MEAQTAHDKEKEKRVVEIVDSDVESASDLQGNLPLNHGNKTAHEVCPNLINLKIRTSSSHISSPAWNRDFGAASTGTKAKSFCTE
jgi:hypothetical protein